MFKGILLALVTITAAPLAAQNFEGSIRGVVRDEDGVVRGAAVQLTDDDTGLIRRTRTTRGGEYEFADVRPGSYAIRVTMDGYKTWERSHLRLGTQAFVTLDVPLEVGSLQESVAVTADGAPPASTASVGTLIDARSLDAWPSAGRNVFVTAAATPMVMATGDSRFVRQQDQSNSSLISLGGGPRRDNAYVLDGVPIVDILNRATFIPSFEAVEEMRVQISDYDAEIGRTSGGVFNTTARSGSNVWHGSALYQDRPSAAQAQSYFAARNDLPSADGYYHLAGGSLGGPLVHNRAFFWASSEGYRSSTSRSTVLVLPTAAERRGDFSQAGTTLYDPLTTRADPGRPGQFLRDPFPNNQIPSSRLNPVAIALLPYLPLPTSGTSRPAVADLVDAANQITGKLTQRWTDRIVTSALFAWYGSTEPDARFYGQPVFTNAADPGEGALVRRNHMLALNATWTPTDRTVVEARYGLNSFLDDNRPASFDPGQLGFAPAFLARVPQTTFPSIGVAGYGGNGFLGDRSQQTATYYSQTLSANVSTLLGRHTLKTGGEARVNGVRFLNLGGMGSYNFDRAFTLGPDPNQPSASSGDAFADFLLGVPSAGNISVSSPIDAYLDYWSGFVQDDVRVSSRLTISAGLRYELETGLRERNDRMAVGWAPGDPFPIEVNGTRPDGAPLVLTGGLRYAGVDGAPTHQGDPRHAQFAPRLSAAYAASDRTTLRGGYGLFWAPPQGISADEYGSGTPGYNQSTSYVAAGANPFLPCATCSLSDPFPAGFAAPAGNSAGRLTGVGGTIEFVDPRSHAAHFHRYSI
ncbi:MAG: hypothetical protein JWL71_1452, partial [Acidobacteria bacterium]|nr:hypothetical protein [Acidobacteriota bacterium]